MYKELHFTEHKIRRYLSRLKKVKKNIFLFYFLRFTSLRSKRSRTSRARKSFFAFGPSEKLRREHPTPSPLLPHFCSRLTSRAAELPSPHFLRDPNAKKLFRLVRFHSGTLSTQANVLHLYKVARSLVRPFARSLVCSFVRSLARSSVPSFVRPFARSFIRSFVRSIVGSLVR